MPLIILLYYSLANFYIIPYFTTKFYDITEKEKKRRFAPLFLRFFILSIFEEKSSSDSLGKDKFGLSKEKDRLGSEGPYYTPFKV